ncbi:MAG: DoxX family protein, partial [Verrucomicrobiaceae bacterium]
MKKFFFDCGTRDPLASYGLVVLRLAYGWMMLYGHGIAKIQNFDKLKDAWPVPGVFPLNLMSHPISLVATIGAEVGAAGLLMLGFMTRPAAFVLGFAMCIAAFQVQA